jgi:hypothetical protein
LKEQQRGNMKIDASSEQNYQKANPPEVAELDHK